LDASSARTACDAFSVMGAAGAKASSESDGAGLACRGSCTD
jgi:hypothetical protein